MTPPSVLLQEKIIVNENNWKKWSLICYKSFLCAKIITDSYNKSNNQYILDSKLQNIMMNTLIVFLKIIETDDERRDDLWIQRDNTIIKSLINYNVQKYEFLKFANEAFHTAKFYGIGLEKCQYNDCNYILSPRLRYQLVDITSKITEILLMDNSLRAYKGMHSLIQPLASISNKIAQALQANNTQLMHNTQLQAQDVSSQKNIDNYLQSKWQDDYTHAPSNLWDQPKNISNLRSDCWQTRDTSNWWDKQSYNTSNWWDKQSHDTSNWWDKQSYNTSNWWDKQSYNTSNWRDKQSHDTSNWWDKQLHNTSNWNDIGKSSIQTTT